ncbi:MAG: hypothetical protein AAGG48_09050 [Planctomycetota bacterium]
MIVLGRYWTLWLCVIAATEQARQSSNVEAAHRLKGGMTQEEVLEIMGPPDIDYRPTWNHWCYGTSLDFETICSAGGRFIPIPLKLRLFSYGENDVVVRWNVNDKVMSVDRPESLPAPELSRKMLEVVQFIRVVDSIIR